MRMLCAAAVTIALLAAPVVHAESVTAGSWDDGLAEVDGYHWTGMRYGQERHGQAVMIFVAEPFRASEYVKANDPSKNPSDIVRVLKLNFIRDFQTGIYSYHTMVSTFVRTSDLAPVKTTFSASEWCGQVYEELLFGAQGIRMRYSSYYEGESGSAVLPLQPTGLTGDNLFIALRGYRGTYLQPGAETNLAILPSAFYRRLNHQPIEWEMGQISRDPTGEQTTVPAGTFNTMVYRVTVNDGRTGVFNVERAYPHRIIRWRWMKDGKLLEKGALSGSARLEYWKLHNNGDERYLKELGLQPLPSD